MSLETVSNILKKYKFIFFNEFILFQILLKNPENFWKIFKRCWATRHSVIQPVISINAGPAYPLPIPYLFTPYFF